MENISAHFYDSPSQIKALLEQEGLTLKKRWGQNFLINKGAREKLLKLLAPGPKDYVWEIGPGLGAMTFALLKLVRRLIVFEIDRGLIRVIESILAKSAEAEVILVEGVDSQGEKYPPDAVEPDGALKIVAGDFLKTWSETAARQGKPDKILGNLPYASASAFILALIEEDCVPEKMLFTIQKEMYQRITALPGSKNYSSFSVVCQFACHIQYHGDLKPGSFYPEPGVVSSIIEMTPRCDLVVSINRKTFFQFTQAIFTARRKMLRNNLLNAGFWTAEQKELVLQVLEQAGFELHRRAEEYKVEDFVRMCEELSRAKLL